MAQKKSLLVVFTKNPQLGRVKTRLAQSIGKEKALLIHRKLQEKTAQILHLLDVDIHLYYSDYIENNDLWDEIVCEKKVQQGNDLGVRMHRAFTKSFSQGYSEVLIIGSDLWELQVEDIEEAVEKLKTHDCVLGPATDGGYYLLGIKQLYPQLFHNKAWGTRTVFSHTLKDLRHEKVFLLKEKNDIDYYEDLLPHKELHQLIE